METTTTTCFIVQKSSFVEGGWQRHYDNPEDDNAPTDYLALFTTRQYAELVAYKSAHVYAQHHHAVVRTLSMPTTTQQHAAHSDAHQQQQPSTSSLPNYAYTVAGKLFWVRRVLVQGQMEHDDSNSSSECKGAQCILTNGAIGFGMTNHQNSTTVQSLEVETDCAFVGPNAQVRALQTMVARRQQPPVSVVWWLPIGGIAGNGGNDNNLMQGWNRTNQADCLVSSSLDHNNNNENENMMDDDMQQQQQQQQHQEMMAATLASVENAANNSKRHHEMQHGAPPRPSKRFCSSSSSFSSSSSSSSLGNQYNSNHHHAFAGHHHHPHLNNSNSNHLITTTHPGTGEEVVGSDLHRSYMM